MRIGYAVAPRRRLAVDGALPAFQGKPLDRTKLAQVLCPQSASVLFHRGYCATEKYIERYDL